MQSAPARGRRSLAGLVAVLILSAIWFGQPGIAAASTESSMESALRTLLNNDRVAHGLTPLRKDARLDLLSGDRATWMATQGLLTHDSADGSVCNAMSKRSIFWYRCGEDIGFTTATWGNTAARFIYNLWKHSAPHWSLMMSNRYNYLGVGVARRTNGTTYASLVFLEGPDHTRPTARMQTHTRSGTTIRFTWSGRDTRLQTHTAGTPELQRRLPGRQRTVRPDPDGHDAHLVDALPPRPRPLVHRPGPVPRPPREPVLLVARRPRLGPLIRP